MYEGKLVRLRALRPEDAEKAVIWLNDLETVQRNLCSLFSIYRKDLVTFFFSAF